MNRSNARGRKTSSGYIGEYRRVWKADYEPVQKLDGRGQFIGPRIFETEAEAEAAAWRIVRDIEEPIMVRSGTMVSKARESAEAVFMRATV